MEERSQAAAGPDGVREWLMQLERRISELEREAERRERARRRSLVFLLVAGALYVLFVYWGMKALP